MELKVKLSEVKHALLKGNAYPFTCTVFRENGNFFEAQCSDIEHLEYGWALIFRALNIGGEFDFESFEIRFNRYRCIAARYEKIRYVDQHGYLYCWIRVSEKEID